MARKKRKIQSIGTSAKKLKNLYSKREILNIALCANYVIAALIEELGENAYCKIFHNLETRPKPKNETSSQTWMTLHQLAKFE